MNVIYFQGKTVIKSEELKETTELTQFKEDDGKLKEQVRDLAKFWEKEGMVFAFFGVENQTKEGKTEEALRAGEDEGYRKELYEIYGI